MKLENRHPCHDLKTRGAVLVIALIMLAVVTFIVIAYMAFAQRDRASVNMSIIQTENRFLLDSGLAIAQKNILEKGTNVQLFVSANDHRGVDLPTAPRGEQYAAALGPITETGGAWTPMPRAPVYFDSNGDKELDEFRFFMDLNRDSEYQVTQGILSGDPDWIGVLENPDKKHGPDNRFIGRFAYMVVPASKTLDLNRMHNVDPDDGDFYRDGDLRDPWADPADPYDSSRMSTASLNLAGTLAALNSDLAVPTWNYAPDSAFAHAGGLFNYQANEKPFFDIFDLFSPSPPQANYYQNFSDQLNTAGGYGFYELAGSVSTIKQPAIKDRLNLDQYRHNLVANVDPTQLLPGANKFFISPYGWPVAAGNPNANIRPWGGWPNGTRVCLYSTTGLVPLVEDPLTGDPRAILPSDVFYVKTPRKDSPQEIQLYWNYRADPNPEDDINEEEFQGDPVKWKDTTLEEFEWKPFYSYLAGDLAYGNDGSAPGVPVDPFFFSATKGQDSTLQSRPPGLDPSSPAGTGRNVIITSYHWTAGETYPVDRVVCIDFPALGHEVWYRAKFKHVSGNANSPLQNPYIWERLPWKLVLDANGKPQRYSDYDAGLRLSANYRLDRSLEMFEEVAARLLKMRSKANPATSRRIVKTRSDDPYLGRPVFNIRVDGNFGHGLDTLTDDEIDKIFIQAGLDPDTREQDDYRAQYSPEVERLLQVAANIVDVYTPPRERQDQANNTRFIGKPSVFRPLYGQTRANGPYDVIRHFIMEPYSSFLRKIPGSKSIIETKSGTVIAGKSKVNLGQGHGLGDGTEVILSGANSVNYGEADTYWVRYDPLDEASIELIRGNQNNAASFDNNTTVTLKVLAPPGVNSPDDRINKITYHNTLGFMSVPLFIGAKQQWQDDSGEPHITPAINEISAQWIMRYVPGAVSERPYLQPFLRLAVEIHDPSTKAARPAATGPLVPMQLHVKARTQDGMVSVKGTTPAANEWVGLGESRQKSFKLNNHFPVKDNYYLGGIQRYDIGGFNAVTTHSDQSNGYSVAKYTEIPLIGDNGLPITFRTESQPQFHPWELTANLEISVTLTMPRGALLPEKRWIIDHAEPVFYNGVKPHKNYFPGEPIPSPKEFIRWSAGSYNKGDQVWFVGERYICKKDGVNGVGERVSENDINPDGAAKLDSSGNPVKKAILKPDNWTMLNWEWNHFKNRHPAYYPKGAVLKGYPHPPGTGTGEKHHLFICTADYPPGPKLLSDVATNLIHPYGGETVEFSWQANDPILNGRRQDFSQDCNGEIHVGSGIAHRPQLQLEKNLAPKALPTFFNVGRPNPASQPWDNTSDAGGNLTPINQSVVLVDSHHHKDPGLLNTSNWDFPNSGHLKNIGDLGRIHRGTPWQTVFLKAPPPDRPITLISNGTVPHDDIWREWVYTEEQHGILGDGVFWSPERPAQEILDSDNFKWLLDQTHPRFDRFLLDEFNVFPNDSEFQEGLLSINQTQYPAWAAAMSGIHLYRGNQRMEPGGSMKEVVNEINMARGAKKWTRFSDILEIPRLSSNSTYLPPPANPRTEEQYEALPRGILPLLRVDQEERYAVYVYSQVLRPASGGVLSNRLVTNYKVVGEAGARTIFKIVKTSKPDKTTKNIFVVENYTPMEIR